MKRTRVLISCLAFLWVSIIGLHQAEGAGIADTYHNLMPAGGGGAAAGPGTIKGQLNEICVYCHTPHMAATADNTSGPLWNRTVSSATFTLYSSSTLNSTPTQPSGVSKACLSCHAGDVSINALLNWPGSGAGTAIVKTDTKIGTAPAVQSNDMSLIGTDLSNDHPVSMVYANAKSPGLGTATIGDDTNTSGFRPTILSGTRTLVDGTAVAGTAPATTLQLPLYTGGKVECASCHDPHEARTKVAQSGTGGSVWFLRASNDGSQLCRTCHLK